MNNWLSVMLDADAVLGGHLVERRMIDIVTCRAEGEDCVASATLGRVDRQIMILVPHHREWRVAATLKPTGGYTLTPDAGEVHPAFTARQIDEFVLDYLSAQSDR